MPLTIEDIETIQPLGDIETVLELIEHELTKHLPGITLFGTEDKAVLRCALAPSGLAFRYREDRSVTSNIDDLLHQAEAIDHIREYPNAKAAMLQHLVGAKMDLVLGAGQVEHHGFSVADHSTERPGDFAVDGVAIHVTTHPSEALIRKTGVNLQQGLKPVIVTYGKGVALADLLLQQSEWAGRVDVLDIGQFLMANVVERSFFRATDYKATLSAILNRYNEIVEACETDPVLKIRL